MAKLIKNAKVRRLQNEIYRRRSSWKRWIWLLEPQLKRLNLKKRKNLRKVHRCFRLSKVEELRKLPKYYYDKLGFKNPWKKWNEKVKMKRYGHPWLTRRKRLFKLIFRRRKRYLFRYRLNKYPNCRGWRHLKVYRRLIWKAALKKYAKKWSGVLVKKPLKRLKGVRSIRKPLKRLKGVRSIHKSWFVLVQHGMFDDMLKCIRYIKKHRDLVYIGIASALYKYPTIGYTFYKMFRERCFEAYDQFWGEWAWLSEYEHERAQIWLPLVVLRNMKNYLGVQSGVYHLLTREVEHWCAFQKYFFYKVLGWFGRDKWGISVKSIELEAVWSVVFSLSNMLDKVLSKGTTVALSMWLVITQRMLALQDMLTTKWGQKVTPTTVESMVRFITMYNTYFLYKFMFMSQQMSFCEFKKLRAHGEPMYGIRGLGVRIRCHYGRRMRFTFFDLVSRGYIFFACNRLKSGKNKVLFQYWVLDTKRGLVYLESHESLVLLNYRVANTKWGQVSLKRLLVGHESCGVQTFSVFEKWHGRLGSVMSVEMKNCYFFPWVAGTWDIRGILKDNDNAVFKVLQRSPLKSKSRNLVYVKKKNKEKLLIKQSENVWGPWEAGYFDNIDKGEWATKLHLVNRLDTDI